VRRALISGITGQDGSYLAELLLSKGYEVHGIVRPSTQPRQTALGVNVHVADLTDAASIDRVMLDVSPDEIYNLAAQSHVGTSFYMPAHTMEVTGLGALNMLDSYRRHAKHARFYQASSSEMFGNQPAPQSETTPFAPVSPYAAAKVLAHNSAVLYREGYGLHVSCGILFNHESPRRGENFVTRKITLGLARIKAGLQDKLVLGNLSARRDWGYAPEYVEAMWLMLQRDTPGDFVIGTGDAYTVGEFLSHARDYVDVDSRSIEVADSEKRIAEVNMLRALPSKACTHLHWKAKTHMPELARIMMEADMKAVGL
jgi:GDPmannose 4,6-dehydratase